MQRQQQQQLTAQCADVALALAYALSDKLICEQPYGLPTRPLTEVRPTDWHKRQSSEAHGGGSRVIYSICW